MSLTYSFEITFHAFMFAMLAAVGIGAVLAVWIMRISDAVTSVVVDVDTGKYDVSMLVEQCKNPCAMCEGDRQVCSECGKPGSICVCPESVLPTPRPCPVCAMSGAT